MMTTTVASISVLEYAHCVVLLPPHLVWLLSEAKSCMLLIAEERSALLDKPIHIIHTSPTLRELQNVTGMADMPVSKMWYLGAKSVVDHNFLEIEVVLFDCICGPFLPKVAIYLNFVQFKCSSFDNLCAFLAVKYGLKD